MTGPHANSATTVAAGVNHRLTLDVPLGPSNQYQQETAQAQAAGTAVYTTYVKVRRLRD